MRTKTVLRCLASPSDRPLRKKDKDKKKGADKKKAINEDSVAANKKGAAAESWPRIAESWGGETHPLPVMSDRGDGEDILVATSNMFRHLDRATCCGIDCGLQYQVSDPVGGFLGYDTVRIPCRIGEHIQLEVKLDSMSVFQGDDP